MECVWGFSEGRGGGEGSDGKILTKELIYIYIGITHGKPGRGWGWEELGKGEKIGGHFVVNNNKKDIEMTDCGAYSLCTCWKEEDLVQALQPSNQSPILFSSLAQRSKGGQQCLKVKAPRVTLSQRDVMVGSKYPASFPKEGRSWDAFPAVPERVHPGLEPCVSAVENGLLAYLLLISSFPFSLPRDLTVLFGEERG